MDYAAAVQRGGPGFAIDEMARLLLHKSVPAFPPSAGVAISRGGTGGPFAAIGVWGIGLRHGQWLTGNTDDEVGMRAVRILLKIVVAVIVVAALGGGSLFFYKTQAAVTPVACFRNQSVKRGNLVSTISATGTLEAEEVVNVGSQVSGRIVEFGKDRRNPEKTVDYESVVEKGDLLAKIDPTVYEVSLDQSKATLAQSKANLMQYEAKLKQAEQEWKRAKSLLPQKAIADTDYDAAIYSYESAKANVALGKATLQQNEAAVRLAQVNLEYCTINSPVRGTIIDRRVNVGQTMAASLSAPSLFLIAKDLTKMQVWASVNEADIGRIRGRAEVPVRFTVDAYPGETFRGKVIQVRQNAQMTQNVVTYMVIVATENSDGKLLPYLTANVQFEVDKRENVLLAPNAALRWEPEPEQIDPSVDQTTLAADPATKSKRGRIWVITRDVLVRPIHVATGLTDGVVTEISGDDVREGLKVVVGEDEEASETANQATSDGGEAKNPFIPTLRKGSKPPPGPM
jgi:HlyD family secretion protein